jgi:hypothetical protein
MTEPWIEELEGIEVDRESASHAVGRGDEYDGVRVDGTAQDLAAVVEGAVSSYNATVPEDEEVRYRMDGPDAELIVPERIYADLDEDPAEALLAIEDRDGMEQYDIVVSTGDDGPGFTSVGEAIVDRYASFEEVPDELADDLYTAVDGHLMQDRMLYVDGDRPRTGTDALLEAAGGQEEGVSVLYRAGD